VTHEKKEYAEHRRWLYERWARDPYKAPEQVEEMRREAEAAARIRDACACPLVLDDNDVAIPCAVHMGDA
jgi:hypothetical protein